MSLQHSQWNQSGFMHSAMITWEHEHEINFAWEAFAEGAKATPICSSDWVSD